MQKEPARPTLPSAHTALFCPYFSNRPSAPEKPILFKTTYAQHVRSSVAPWTYSPPGFSVHGISQAGMGCHFLLQGIFSTQGLNPWLLHLLHWQADSLPLSSPGKWSWKGATQFNTFADNPFPLPCGDCDHTPSLQVHSKLNNIFYMRKIKYWIQLIFAFSLLPPIIFGYLPFLQMFQRVFKNSYFNFISSPAPKSMT